MGTGESASPVNAKPAAVGLVHAVNNENHETNTASLSADHRDNTGDTRATLVTLHTSRPSNANGSPPKASRGSRHCANEFTENKSCKKSRTSSKFMSTHANVWRTQSPANRTHLQQSVQSTCRGEVM